MLDTIIDSYKESGNSLFFGFLGKTRDSLVSIKIDKVDKFDIVEIFTDNKYLCNLMNKDAMCLVLSASLYELIKLIKAFKASDGTIDFDFQFYKEWKEANPILVVFSNYSVSSIVLQIFVDNSVYQELRMDFNE